MLWHIFRCKQKFSFLHKSSLSLSHTHLIWLWRASAIPLYRTTTEHIHKPNEYFFKQHKSEKNEMEKSKIQANSVWHMNLIRFSLARPNIIKIHYKTKGKYFCWFFLSSWAAWASRHVARYSSTISYLFLFHNLPQQYDAASGDWAGRGKRETH